MTTSHRRGFHVDLARPRWTQIGRRRRRRRGGTMSFLLRLSLVPCASVRGTLGRVPPGGGASERGAGGRASGWAHSRARSHTRPCAALESTRDDDDDGDRGRRSSRCRSGAESVCEVLPDRVRRVIIGDRPQFLSVIPTSCAATRATTDRPSRSRCPAAASQC